MKYKFHVGDYVETVKGFIGLVSYVDRNYITMKSNEGIISGPWSIPDEQYHFNRIGQYDFTKKDKGKIESLSDNYTESFPIFKTQNSVTGKTYKQECYSIDIGVISKKINELVEAVNWLEEKVNAN